MTLAILIFKSSCRIRTWTVLNLQLVQALGQEKIAKISKIVPISLDKQQFLNLILQLQF